jgi:hypothetical protein
VVNAFLSVDLSLLGLNYYCVGILCRKYDAVARLARAPGLVLVALAGLAFAAVWMLAQRGNVWYAGPSVLAYGRSFAGGVVGSLMVISCSLLLERGMGALRLVERVSQVTLLMLGFQVSAIRAADGLLAPLRWHWAAVAALSLLLLVSLCLLVDRLAPQIGGRRARRVKILGREQITARD